MSSRNVPLIVIVTDSITNTVFPGQVLAPLEKICQERTVHLISFEPSPRAITMTHDHIRLTFLKRMPFVGSLTIAYGARLLKKILEEYPFFEIRARGPLAGAMARRILDDRCRKLTIQARGLLAEEYRYAHPPSRFHTFRTRQYRTVEQEAYRPQNADSICSIEAVTPHLIEYLVSEYGTRERMCTVAKEDIPELIPFETREEWRAEIRARLGIPFHDYILCYAGSSHPWQQPQQIVAYGVEQLQRNPDAHLLILTQDPQAFEKYAEPYDFDRSRFIVMQVPHHEVMQYLCACDAGLLFREADIVNWVSRPTKALEYAAANLTILHNHTIGWLCTKKVYKTRPATSADSMLANVAARTARKPNALNT